MPYRLCRLSGQNGVRSTAIARRLHASFSLLLRLQEMRQALTTAEDLDLNPALHQERREILQTIGTIADAQSEDARAQAANALTNAKTFLKNLARTLK